VIDESGDSHHDDVRQRGGSLAETSCHCPLMLIADGVRTMILCPPHDDDGNEPLLGRPFEKPAQGGVAPRVRVCGIDDDADGWDRAMFVADHDAD
jgi:hypothetical protein